MVLQHPTLLPKNRSRNSSKCGKIRSFLARPTASHKPAQGKREPSAALGKEWRPRSPERAPKKRMVIDAPIRFDIGRRWRTFTIQQALCNPDEEIRRCLGVACRRSDY